jgi:hypothetical protein
MWAAGPKNGWISRGTISAINKADKRCTGAKLCDKASQLMPNNKESTGWLSHVARGV